MTLSIKRSHIFRISFIPVFLLAALTARPQDRQRGDSIVRAIEPEYAAVSRSHTFWLGENYRDLWAAPVKMKVFSLAGEQGGLRILKRGGGMQTRSLRLADPSGKEWVLRTVQKYPERGMDPRLRKTVAKNILQDQVSAINPFGAFAIPVLAGALGVPHTNPQLVYLPDDPLLGEYRQEFANAVYIFEERAPVEEAETDNTEKVQRKVQEDNDTGVDQKLVLRARLLDMLVGDWDRHEDQWRWEKTKDGDETVYLPVPRDRDQVFYKTSGVLPWIVSHQWLKSKFQGYSEEIRDVNGWNFNARYFDRYFLNGLDKADWEKQVRFVQQRLSDSVIARAISVWPDTVIALAGGEISRKLKARRNGLMETALTYYHFLARTVEVPASDKPEFFDLDYRKDGAVRLKVSNIKKDRTKGRKVYEREFEADETREIRLYGLDSENVFDVGGAGKSPIRVRMVGGPLTDSFRVAPKVVNKKRLFVYDRRGAANALPASSLARLKLSSDTAVHAYDKFSFKYDRRGPMFMASYDIDQGVQLRAGFISEKQGFRKEPYASRHEFWVNYSTGRESFRLDYSADFTKAIGNYNLKIDLHSLGPNNVSNFFGKGNETVFEDSEDKPMLYYRNRYDYVTAEVKLGRQLLPGLAWEGGLAAEFYTSSAANNQHKFLGAYDASFGAEDVFRDRFYGGLVTTVNYDTRPHSFMPYKGILWNTRVSLMRQLAGGSRLYARVQTDFSLYTSISDSSIVLANRIGGGFAPGDPLFFQQMQLGGQRSLRGFHTNRFNGKAMFFHNIELRSKLFDFTSYLFPGTVGLTAFHDVGRVWQPGASSSRWHNGYGGGLYIIPAELLVIQAQAGFSKEGHMFYVSFGFEF